MTAPAIATLAAELGRPADDPALVRAFGAAMAWARTALGRAVDDTLDDLAEHNHEGVYGYARDTLKLPKAQFGYFLPDNDGGVAVAQGDLGRRWQGVLRYGTGSLTGLA